jgi:hypothetical protein
MGHMKVWRKGRGMHKLLQIYLIKRVKKFGVVHGPRGVGGQDFFFSRIKREKKKSV